MVQLVYEQALQSQLAEVVVATDDERIMEAVNGFGGKAVMTSSAHPAGTDRCAAVAAMPAFDGFQYVVNIQGDEPFVQPVQIDLLLDFLRQNPVFQIATLAKRLTQSADLLNPNLVKAVFSGEGRALYFSRSAVPHVRGEAVENWVAKGVHFKHVGMYAFQRDVLLRLAGLPVGKLEQLESLEQLRWLENGFSIGVVETDFETQGIDTPEDLETSVRRLLSDRLQSNSQQQKTADCLTDCKKNR